MEIQYFKQFSSSLNREMECSIYGHTGHPVLFIPCQDGRYFDFRNYKMANVWEPWIESGQVMVCAIDTIDKETWSDLDGDPAERIKLHEQWFQYITDEVVPFLQEISKKRNGASYQSGVMTFGCSLGAMHAANLYYRRPDLFDRLLALSGLYSSETSFGDYMDGLVYMNSPVHYMANLPWDHSYISMFNAQKSVICVGLGAWELPETTRRMDEILKSKGINTWVDYWGEDCVHDWPWWYLQVKYFLPYLLS